MTDIEQILKHAQLANFDNECTSMVILMVANGEPEAHMVIAPKDVHLMNSACSDLSVDKFRLNRKRNKEFIVNHFGGKCKDCGEVDIRCLSLDHINNDGKLDKLSDNGKKQVSPTWYAKLYKLLVQNKPLPRELQLLCFNCHAKKDLQPWWFKNDME